ncbi:hypothetical protein D3C71_234260 [compost metagenome]
MRANDRKKPQPEEVQTLRSQLKDPEPEYKKPTPVGKFGIVPMGYKNRGFNRFMYTWVITDRMRYYKGQLKTKPVPMSNYAKELLEGTFAKW